MCNEGIILGLALLGEIVATCVLYQPYPNSDATIYDGFGIGDIFIKASVLLEELLNEVFVL
jgi:hypothetical protein